MRSIKTKLIFMYLAMVFIVMVAIGTFMLSFNRTQNIGKARDELKNYARNIEDQIVSVYPPDEFERGFRDMRFSSSSYTLSRYMGSILNTRGQTIASSNLSKDTYRSSVIVAAATGKEEFNSSRWDTDASNGLKREWLEYATYVKDESGEVKYIIFVRADAAPIRTSMGDMAVSLLFTIVMALLLAGVIGYLFANTLTGPIRMLTKIARDMAQGNLNQEIPVKSDDEIGQLTQSFNDMAQELNESMANMAGEKNKMETLLHNMTDGVLAYHASGTLIHANYICQELLNFDGIETLSFYEMMEALGIDIENFVTLAPGTVKEYTLNIEDRFISAIFTAYSNTFGFLEGIIIVLRDITKLKKLDNMRKEFVANVSHELRTPLTTIKSYAETLLDGAIDKKEIANDFLQVINGETDRMTLLVRDLLELSRFDNQQLSFEMAEVNIIDLIHQNIRQNQVLAENKNQTILFQPQTEKIILWLDPQRISQVLTNILSNAIKYSYENSAIEILVEEESKYYRILVKDNGMGIPKEDLEHIFERFYRVDKARSRAMGGTGLGLAIAKEIMEAHKGGIMVKSHLEKGTTMILYFPKEESPPEQNVSVDEA